MSLLLESLNELIEEVTKVIRQGKVVSMSNRRANRPTGGGWKWDAKSNNWKRQTAAEKQMYKIIGKKIARTANKKLPMEIARSNKLRNKSIVKATRLGLS